MILYTSTKPTGRPSALELYIAQILYLIAESAYKPLSNNLAINIVLLRAEDKK